MKRRGRDQRICMNDPWTWATVLGAGSRLDEGGQRGKNWDNYNRITIIKYNKINSCKNKIANKDLFLKNFLSK